LQYSKLGFRVYGLGKTEYGEYREKRRTFEDLIKAIIMNDSNSNSNSNDDYGEISIKLGTIECTIFKETKTAIVSLNRPEKSNAINEQMWIDLPNVFMALNENVDVNCVILRGNGRNFCSGIDISSEKELMNGLNKEETKDRGRRGEYLLRHIQKLQRSVSEIERCRKPVIASIDGYCVGGGLDIASACDIRIASSNAKFSIKEVEIGIVADIGSLQRLPSIIGVGHTMDLALNARVIDANEAFRIGLVSSIAQGDVDEAAIIMANKIASLSPLAVQGTKRAILNARDSSSVEKGLEYVALKNAAQLISDDLTEAVRAKFERRKPIYAKL